MPQTRCDHCKRTANLEEENTVLFVFPSQPWLCYVQFICDKCDEEGSQFLGDFIEELLEHFNKHDYPTIVEEWPEDDVIESFAKVYGKKLLRPHPLSEHDERRVEFFAYELERWDGDVT